jgi:hypothetical protein
VMKAGNAMRSRSAELANLLEEVVGIEITDTRLFGSFFELDHVFVLVDTVATRTDWYADVF